jgi:hypothetical protein
VSNGGALESAKEQVAGSGREILETMGSAIEEEVELNGMQEAIGGGKEKLVMKAPGAGKTGGSMSEADGAVGVVAHGGAIHEKELTLDGRKSGTLGDGVC